MVESSSEHKNITVCKQSVLPVCWNWQTRRTQNPLLETTCGFESHHRHHIIRTLIWIESESLFFTNLRVTTLKCGIIQLLAYENIYRVFGRTEYRGLLILSARDYYNAFFGQFFTHSIHSMHSVPLLRFRELSVISTFIGQRRLHLPHDMHLLLLHVTRTSEK